MSTDELETTSGPAAPARAPRAAGSARQLTTRGETLRFYLAHESPRVMMVALAAVLVARLFVGGWSVADLAVVAVIVAINGPFEWVVHLALLHAPAASFRMRVLRTGVGHRRHHRDPNDLDWVMLTARDVVAFVPMLAVTTGAVTLPWLWLAGWPLLGPYLTALVVTYLALAHYEWTHLLIHTRYRPASRHYRRIAANHRLHHYRNEHYWLGVTTNTGDRLLRTLPASKTDVPLSDTARALSG